MRSCTVASCLGGAPGLGDFDPTSHSSAKWRSAATKLIRVAEPELDLPALVVERAHLVGREALRIQEPCVSTSLRQAS